MCSHQLASRYSNLRLLGAFQTSLDPSFRPLDAALLTQLPGDVFQEQKKYHIIKVLGKYYKCSRSIIAWAIVSPDATTAAELQAHALAVSPSTLADILMAIFVV